MPRVKQEYLSEYRENKKHPFIDLAWHSIKGVGCLGAGGVLVGLPFFGALNGVPSNFFADQADAYVVCGGAALILTGAGLEISALPQFFRDLGYNRRLRRSLS